MILFILLQPLSDTITAIDLMIDQELAITSNSINWR